MNSHATGVDNRQELRKRFRRRRNSLAPDLRHQFDRQIRLNLDRAILDGRFKTIAAFIGFDGEPRLQELLPGLHERGVTIVLPVISEDPGSASMTLNQWHPDCDWKINRFGIPEPSGTPSLQLDDLELLLMPLVAWDRQGGRLGMGGGFYDRLMQSRAHQARPYRCGIAYEIQQAECLPMETWDVPLHGVVTEKGAFTFDR